MNKKSNSKKKEFNKGGKSSPKRVNTKKKFTSVDKENQHDFNDSKWYFRYPELMSATARLAFPNRPGMTIHNFAESNFTAEKGNIKDLNIPGVLAMDYIPSIGKSDAATDPASLTARELYSNVRSKFSGTLTADAPDMLIQIVALSQIYSYIAYLKRIYRSINSTSMNNYMLPYGVLQALGFNQAQATELIRDRIKLFGVVNTLIRSTAKLVCPAVFDITNRHYWMNDKVFSDYNHMNSQLMLFNPVGFYKFALLEDPQNQRVGGLHLEPIVIPSTGIVDYLYQYGLDILNSLTEWDSCYDINGYFQQAFNDVSMFTVELLLQDEQLEVSYDTTVLKQIQNATLLPVSHVADKEAPTYTFKVDITQDPKTNRVLSDPTIVVDNVMNKYFKYSEGGLININPDEYSEELIVESSRLKALYDVTLEGGTDNTATSTATIKIQCATEALLHMRLVSCDSKGAITLQYMGGFAYASYYSGYSAPSSDGMLEMLMKLKWFYMSPAVILATISPTGTFLKLLYTTDLRNIAQMSVDQFNAINRVCLFSEFNSFSSPK